MRSFRKIFVRAALILLFLWGINKAGQFLYEPATDNLLLSARELKENQGSIDTLIVGSSLMCRGVDTDIFNDKLDTNGFNLATDAQYTDVTYYLLKDEIKRNPIKRVFWGIGAAQLELGGTERTYASKARAMKLIQSPLIKLEFVLTLQPKELETVLFCPARYEDVLSLDYIEQNVTYKLSDDYKNYNSHEEATRNYLGLGHEASSRKFNGKIDKVSKWDVWSRDELDETSVKYIKKVGELCKEEGIELNLIVYPYSPSYSVRQGNLADMDDYMEELAAEIGANLYNYNYTVRADIYDYLPDSYYADKKHLNQYGAVVFTELITDDYLAAQEQEE